MQYGQNDGVCHSTQKFAHIQISKMNPDFKLALTDEVIPQSHDIRYFGLTLEINLEWKTHLTIAIKKANKSLGLIKR